MPTDTLTEDQQAALTILDGVEQIARNEMLRRGHYFSQEIVNRDLADSGAICGGHNVCAIGALWTAAGVMSFTNGSVRGESTGMQPSARADWLMRKGDRYPGLARALDALNEAALRYASRRGISLHNNIAPEGPNFPDEIERLFESYYVQGPDTYPTRSFVEAKLDPKSFIEVIDLARGIVGEPFVGRHLAAVLG